MKKRLAYSPGRLVAILTFGVFGIINTEMGVVGIIPQIAETFGVTVPQAGWTVGVFALIVAVSAPVMPLLFSGTDRTSCHNAVFVQVFRRYVNIPVVPNRDAVINIDGIKNIYIF